MDEDPLGVGFEASEDELAAQKDRQIVQENRRRGRDLMGHRADAKAATRAKVLEGARTLFEQHGYDAVGIRQIGDAIGMSTGAIFANFASKAEVFEAAMEAPPPNVAAFLDSVGWAAAHTKPENALEALRAISAQARLLLLHLRGVRP